VRQGCKMKADGVEGVIGAGARAVDGAGRSD
jgi:hypothetical protein